MQPYYILVVVPARQVILSPLQPVVLVILLHQTSRYRMISILWYLPHAHTIIPQVGNVSHWSYSIGVSVIGNVTPSLQLASITFGLTQQSICHRSLIA